MSDEDLGLPDADAWKGALPDADDWKKIYAELFRKDPRHLRDKATFDFATQEVKPATDFFEWAQWMENASRHIARDEVSGFVVSTVFLGINHNFFGKGEPLWFETMVFRQGTDGNLIASQDYDQFRYSTVALARAGHACVCELVRKGEIGE